MSDAPDPAHDGAIDRFMSRIFGRSWRTTCGGLTSLLLGVLAFAPGVPPAVKDFAREIAPIVAGGGLILAKDARVSGLPKR
jgi:hypothetical protein